VLVPIIGQGTWEMGSAGSRVEEVATLRAGIELGLTHLDTAEMYGNGRAEELIAEAIHGFPREQLFLVSKVLPQNATYEGTMRACEASLRRLRTDYLDVYLLHWRGRVPLAETLRAMAKLVKDGKIRAPGVSNFDLDDLDEARQLLPQPPLACNQVLYHLRDRQVDAGMAEDGRRHDVAIVGYSPFGHGEFPGPDSRQGRALAEIARRHGATPRQVALAFLAREPPLFTIPKASSVAHVRENAGALQLALGAEDVQLIDEVFPIPPASPLRTI
jgi:diketogulonate reductase-like aldo/keto reductase